MDNVEKYIGILREEKCSCSHSTLLGIARAHPENMPDTQTLKYVSGAFRGGIGKTFGEGTCGAVSGAVIGLGLIYAEDEKSACDGAKFVYDGFKNHFGTLCCGKITDEFGKKRCNECCQVAGKLVQDFVNRK